MDGKERTQGYALVRESIIQKYSADIGMRSKAIYDYINSVIEHDYIVAVEIIDEILPQYLIDEIKKHYPVKPFTKNK